jgi:hypothetical protein
MTRPEQTLRQRGAGAFWVPVRKTGVQAACAAVLISGPVHSGTDASVTVSRRSSWQWLKLDEAVLPASANNGLLGRCYLLTASALMPDGFCPAKPSARGSGGSLEIVGVVRL